MKVLHEKKGMYEDSSDFKVVKVNDGKAHGYLFSTEELAKTITGFKRYYTEISKTRGHEMNDSQTNVSLSIDIA